MAKSAEKIDPALEAAKKHEKIAEEAKHLAKLRERLAMVAGFLAQPVGEEATFIVSYSDGKELEHIRFGIYRSEEYFWTTLYRGRQEDARAILGAADTALREQIRHSESRMREMGVANF